MDDCLAALRSDACSLSRHPLPREAGNEDALREAALLGRAWRLTPQPVVRSITCTAHYFTGFRGLYTAQHAIGDILDNW
jgi:hypothetical protein